jgi:DeoR family glycerol-3-phosphate regulon repressor
MAEDLPDLVAGRHARILELARRTGSVSVEALASALEVTPQTIRRDLNQLARQAMLSRVHGGAVVTSGVDNLDREARRQVAAEAKAAIGTAAAALVPDGASLFINIGTTTEAIARALVQHRHLLVVTNNLNVADILGGVPTVEVVVVGGRVRASDRAVVGALAMDFLRGFKLDYALIGASAIDEEGTLLDFDMDEVRVSQTIIEQARTVILATDQTKFGRPAPVRIAEIGIVDHLVTDRLLHPGIAAACAAGQVKVTQTDA